MGLLPLEWPKDNPYSADKVALGRLLYFDKRLSKDDTVACASCHSPEHGYTDGAPNSEGIRGQHGKANPIEMGNTQVDVVAKINAIQGYRVLFQKCFGSPERSSVPMDVTIDNLAKAIATFERTLLSGNSPYDRYKAGNKAALTQPQVHGLEVFVNKAKCDQCHEGVNFTSNSYHNLGVGVVIGVDQPDPDHGRFEVTKDPMDWGAFKTPTLRNVARTAPYMHDGSLKTLDEVVEFYDKGGKPNLDEKIKPLKLTDGDKKDLVEFLKSLNGEGWQKVTAPASFP